MLAAGIAQTAEYRLSSLTKVKAALKLLHGLQIWLWSSSPPTESRILWQSRILWWTAVWSRLPSAGLSATGLPPAGLSAAARVSPARVSGKLWACTELVPVMLDLTDAKLTRLQMWVRVCFGCFIFSSDLHQFDCVMFCSIICIKAHLPFLCL